MIQRHEGQSSRKMRDTGRNWTAGRRNGHPFPGWRVILFIVEGALPLLWRRSTVDAAKMYQATDLEWARTLVGLTSLLPSEHPFRAGNFPWLQPERTKRTWQWKCGGGIPHIFNIPWFLGVASAINCGTDPGEYYYIADSDRISLIVDLCGDKAENQRKEGISMVRLWSDLCRVLYGDNKMNKNSWSLCDSQESAIRSRKRWEQVAWTLSNLGSEERHPAANYLKRSGNTAKIPIHVLLRPWVRDFCHNNNLSLKMLQRGKQQCTGNWEQRRVGWIGMLYRMELWISNAWKKLNGNDRRGCLLTIHRAIWCVAEIRKTAPRAGSKVGIHTILLHPGSRTVR